MTEKPQSRSPNVTIAASSPDAVVLQEENKRLRQGKEQWAIDKRILELKVEKLQRQLWDKKSERLVAGDDKQKLHFQDPMPKKQAEPPAPQRSRGERKPQVPKGPKPLDPSLPREVIKVADPELKELICPETKRPMQPGFIEQIEVLTRRAPEFYVKVYERWVFVSRRGWRRCTRPGHSNQHRTQHMLGSKCKNHSNQRQCMVHAPDLEARMPAPTSLS